MQFTRRTWILFLIGAPLIGAWALGSLWLYLALLWFLFVGALLVADWRLGPQPPDWTLTRHHEDRLSLAAENPITISILLRYWGRSVPIWVRDEAPPTFRYLAESYLLSAVAVPHEEISVHYRLYPPRRGNYHFGDLHVRWQTPLGLWRRQTRLPAAEPVKVYPNLVDVRKYDLLLRKNRLWELGLRNTRLRGTGTEFERLRDYLPDDEYRRINWKATARRGTPMSIEYETERSQNIMVLLDIGRMMRSPVGDVAKLDYAINAILLLAYVSAQKGDKIGLLVFADDVERWVAPRSGKGQFHHMLEQLYAVESLAVEPNYRNAFRYFAARQHKRSLVLVFTDLTSSVSTADLLAQMGRLRQGHLPLLVTMRDPTVQQMAHQPVEDSASLYQRTVAEQLLNERQLALEQLTHRGVLTLDVSADQLSLALINRYLALKAENRI
ncbi:MAG TPA: DUF58 domain-containing protein [Caldilineaceae bacterium]|nr:DUF58 domain-containing protein [Caldilineaceae bacterium]